jgi:spore maturation protein SpmB
VTFGVLRLGDAFQVVQHVVRWVIVFVVDAVAGGDVAVSVLPYFLVQMLNAASDMTAVGAVIHPMRPLLSVGIPTERDALVDDLLGNYSPLPHALAPLLVEDLNGDAQGDF